MKKTVCVVLLGFAFIFSAAARQQQQTGKDMSWAFPAINGSLPAERAGPGICPGARRHTRRNRSMICPIRRTGTPTSTRRLTDRSTRTRGGACMRCCHLMSGEGHPESAGLTGFTAEYIIRQMADFKSGARKTPRG